MAWELKPKQQSWNGQYYRETIIPEVIEPFMKNEYYEWDDGSGYEKTVVDPSIALYAHDKAPMQSALATQALFEEKNIDYLGNDEWSGGSPDLNPTENLGSIVMDRVDKAIFASRAENKYGYDNFVKITQKILKEVAEDRSLLRKLMASMPARFQAVKDAKGGHTRY